MTPTTADMKKNQDELWEELADIVNYGNEKDFVLSDKIAELKTKFTIQKVGEEVPLFTDEEIKTAMTIRDEIIRDDISVLKSIYMAGEIAMWASFKIK